MWGALDNNEVSDEVMGRYKLMVAASVCTSLSRMVYGNCIIEGVKPFRPGQKLVSRARTLRYLPIRLDLVAAARAAGCSQCVFSRTWPSTFEASQL